MPPTANDQQLAFARLLELSELMLANALSDIWEPVFELQDKRQQLIQEFFSAPLLIDDKNVGEGIQHILNCDKQLADMASQHKKSLQKEIIALRQSNDHVKAYQAE